MALRRSAAVVEDPAAARPTKPITAAALLASLFARDDLRSLAKALLGWLLQLLRLFPKTVELTSRPVTLLASGHPRQNKLAYFTRR